MQNHYKVLIIGGGTAGLTVASRLAEIPNFTSTAQPTIGIVEPSDKHYYQPLWTLVGAGVYPKEETERNEADFIPHGTDWLQDFAEAFDPDNNTVTLRSGKTVSYDYLVMAAGIQVDWDKIPGLKESVGKPGTGVVSNYDYHTAESTWQAISNFRGGKMLFTEPDTAVKCGGAPQKIMYLADDALRRQGVRYNSEIFFCTPKTAIFGVQKYREALERVVARKGIEPQWQHTLRALDPAKREATFEHQGENQSENQSENVVINYEMIHVVPPMSSPDFIKRSPLANDAGWVEVDKYTLQHCRYSNVFGLGDNSSLPTSKTGAAIRKQAPVVVDNLLAASQGRPLEHHYDGYTSCPLVTGYGKLILAEFDYDGNPQETFPFDQSQERYSMYILKKVGLPRLYWHGMLRGRA